MIVGTHHIQNYAYYTYSCLPLHMGYIKWDIHFTKTIIIVVETHIIQNYTYYTYLYLPLHIRYIKIRIYIIQKLL